MSGSYSSRRFRRGRRKGSAGVEQRNMTSRDQKKAVLHEKLQLLRSVTNSSAVRRLVTVETLEKGFLINVFSDKNCPGLLVSVLQAFQELGLDVLDATISSADSFRLEAIGGEAFIRLCFFWQPQNESVDAQMVRQVVVQAIKKCTGS
ncbi:hypothetical protein BHM03_00050613 [Ensete ventricosum]|uniref:Plant bHLH transcription factor ACT-like domain-containing protein n=1 Tax=Ensete ventricosum TaxID=4639 RepID=A0A445MLJ1_ENSVE|nr:hypothetical protein BHM03_00050613 [Ensete ventricosum]